MRNKKIKLFFGLVIILVIITISAERVIKKRSSGETEKEVAPFLGSIRNIISCTATVLPKNRLELKPPVNGRIESILAKEGDLVRTGQVLAWMSSTERAALLDAARGQGEKSLEYWEQTYKPIPLSAPIDGQVIVATIQPGQTVTTADAVLVLSDKLIVRAQVDEIDIGKIKESMKAFITIDAYPDTKVEAYVDHIYYESKTVNNVTVYEVDLAPKEILEFFRSGMNASVDFIIQEKEDALLVPGEAVYKEDTTDYVLVKQADGKAALKTQVELGISDDKNIEVISGISEKDSLIVKTKKYFLPKSATSTNPFMPARRR
jgi:macrolide-specific efflux system membrane fusion protein